MEYLPLFLLLMAALIAAYFYLEKAKKRDVGSASGTSAEATPAEATPPATDPGDETH